MAGLSAHLCWCGSCGAAWLSADCTDGCTYIHTYTCTWCSAGHPWWRPTVWHCHLVDLQAAQGASKGGGGREGQQAGRPVPACGALCVRGGRGASAPLTNQRNSSAQRADIQRPTPGWDGWLTEISNWRDRYFLSVMHSNCRLSLSAASKHYAWLVTLLCVPAGVGCQVQVQAELHRVQVQGGPAGLERLETLGAVQAARPSGHRVRLWSPVGPGRGRRALQVQCSVWLLHPEDSGACHSLGPLLISHQPVSAGRLVLCVVGELCE